MIHGTRPGSAIASRLARHVALVHPVKLAAACLVLALVLAAAVTLSGLLGDSSPRPSPQRVHPAVSVPEVDTYATSPVLSGADSQGGRALQPAAVPPGDPQGASWGRRILRWAALEVELPDVDRAISRLAEIVESAGGFVAATEAQTDATGTARATITAYVPPDRFSRALAGLEDLGRVRLRRISGQDVSEEFVDLEARVRNLERHESQLLGFMGRANKVSDLLSLENELARVRGEIERLTGRLRFLKGRTEMATIQVSLLRAPGATSPDDSLARAWERILAAFRDGWYGAFRLVAAVAVFGAQMSPLAVPLLMAWALYRRWISRRTATTPPGVPAAP